MRWTHQIRNHETAIRALVVLSAVAVVLWQPGDGWTQEQQDPNQLMAEVIANELKAQQGDNSLWCYTRVQYLGKDTEELEFVDTPEGTIHRLLRRDGKSLSAEESRKEDARITDLLSDRAELQKREQQEKKDLREEKELLRELPAAFEFRYAGRQGQLVKLDFSPRPAFKPTGREGEVFHHMSGTVIVDPVQRRIAEIHGRLTSEVKFGGGFLGRLAKGGTFDVVQSDLGDGHWELSHLRVDMHGKILFFKTVAVNQDEEDSDFTPLPQNLSLARAAEILRAGPQCSSSARGQPRSMAR